MPSNKRWCVEVSGWGYLPKRHVYELLQRDKFGPWMRRHLFKTRSDAEWFLKKYGGRFRYTYSQVKRVK